ncbi:Hypothetical protein HVR_LOCUS28 [uncultured virus]|nr:Hypothetical protein HVR_LOCUS28 [uncultured virus]
MDEISIPITNDEVKFIDEISIPITNDETRFIDDESKFIDEKAKFINDEVKCAICLETLGESIILTPCQHKIHNECFHNLLRKSVKPIKCPLCRSILTNNEITGNRIKVTGNDNQATDTTIYILSTPDTDEYLRDQDDDTQDQDVWCVVSVIYIIIIIMAFGVCTDYVLRGKVF